MIETLLTYLSVSIIATIIFYVIGGTLSNLLKISYGNPFLKSFANIFFGMVVAVLFYSIIITRCNTVMTGLFIPICFILSIIIKKDKPRTSLIESMKINPKIILLGILVITLFAAYNFYFLWDATTNLLVPPEADKVFYARVADYYNVMKIESPYLDYFNTNNPAPYHHFELWLTALAASLSGLNTLLIQQLSINAIFSLVLSFGVMALVNHFKKITIADALICLLFPFFIGIKFPFVPPQFFHHFDFYFFRSAAVYQKYYVINPLFLASFLLFLNRKRDIALLVLLPLCFFNFALLLAVTVSVLLFCMLIRIENRIKICVATILSCCFIMLFYQFNNRTEMMLNNPPLLDLMKDTFTSFAKIKIAFDINLKNFVQLFITYFPFTLAFMYLWNRGAIVSKPLSLLVLLLFTCSSIEWSVFTMKVDSIQLFYNLAVPLTSTFCLFVSILFISKWEGLRKNLAYTFLLSWCCYCVLISSKGLDKIKNDSMNGYAPEYLQSVESKLLQLNNQGGYMGYKNHESIMYNVYAYKPYLAYFKNNINITLIEETKDIKPELDPFLLSQQKQFLKVLFFNRFIDHQKENNEYHSEAQSRIDFIRQNHLSFIIVDTNVAMDSLLQAITDTVIMDKNNGERFVVLKK